MAETKRSRLSREDSRARILDSALISFADRGFEATSLDVLAKQLGISKQSILYHFPSKEALLDSAIDRSADELRQVLEAGIQEKADAWGRVESVVRATFRLAARRPQLLGFVREVTRLGPPAATRMTNAFEELLDRATKYLQLEMNAGRMRKQEPRLVMLSAYSTVIGVATEVEVLRALGEEPTPRSLLRRRNELLRFLHSALME